MTEDAPTSTPEALPIPSIDRMQMVQVMREVASSIEKGYGNLHELMHAVGTELMVLALKYRPPEIDGPDPEATEQLVRREIGATLDSILKFHRSQMTERAVLNERLMRVFDPYLAWNETVNRVIKQKTEAMQAPILPTPQQTYMFENMQLPATRKALFNAGLRPDEMEPTVHRLSGIIGADGSFAPDVDSTMKALPPREKPPALG